MIKGVKYDGGKARHDLIPPELPEAVATVLAFGAAKYTVEVKNEWDAILLARNVVEFQVTTPKGSVVAVTRNISGQPIPNLQSASVRTGGTGRPATQSVSLSWPSVASLIQSVVSGTPRQNGQADLQRSASQRVDMMSFALPDAQSAEQKNTCTLTIVTKQGNLEVFFAPDAITASDFWMTVWRDLSERFDISRPQNNVGERNWEKGMGWGRPFAALMRHMWAWWRGEKLDPETGLSHLHHAACNIAFLIAFEARNTGVDDRPV